MASKVLLMKQQRAEPVCLAVSTRLSMSRWERSVGPKWLVPTVICKEHRVALCECQDDRCASQLLLDPQCLLHAQSVKCCSAGLVQVPRQQF